MEIEKTKITRQAKVQLENYVFSCFTKKTAISTRTSIIAIVIVAIVIFFLQSYIYNTFIYIKMNIITFFSGSRTQMPTKRCLFCYCKLVVVQL